MATPAPYIDQTAGLELYSGDEVAIEATRWLFLAGDLLNPDRRNDLPHLEAGGEELANICLRRTNGFVPRCTLTPMEMWAEFMPMEFFPEGVRPLKIKGEQIVDQNPNGATFIGKPLYGYPHYPGELIIDALGVASGQRRGIVEIKRLTGVNVGQGDAEHYQNLFFPATWERSRILRLVTEQIQRVADANPNGDVVSIAEDMLKSAETFRNYALGKISIMNTQLDQRIKHDWVYSYSPQILSFLDQLEIPARGVGVQENLSAAVLQAAQRSGLSEEALTQLQQRDSALISQLTNVFMEGLDKVMKTVNTPKPPTKSKE